ncbi:hypothetical protein B0H12DRAFT_1320227 [Mycena haematopus]|nr:hypothetical protein B0H12DRAFT_1320227 [Mycena haematopus]
MFHPTYPHVLSYRAPVSQINPREKYLAALAEAKAAEAEYLAAEQLQQEENQLRQRLEQIQRLRNQPSAYYTYTPATQYPQAAPLDFEALRRQIVAEERARIVREQEVKALRVQETQRQARELEAFRIHEGRKAQRAEVGAFTHRALVPSVRFVVSEDAHGSRTRHAHSHHRGAYLEFRNSVGIPLLAATAKHHHAHDCGCERKALKESKTTDVNIEDLLSRLLGVRANARQPKPQESQPRRTVGLEHLLQHAPGHAASQPKTDTKPAKETTPQRQAEVPITLEQLLGHLLGATGIDVERSPASTSNAAAPAEKKEVPSAPAPPRSATKPAPAATAAVPQAPQHIDLHHIWNTLGSAAECTAAPSQSNQGPGVELNLQQLFNMFLGGAAPAPAQPQAGSSKSASASTNGDSKPAVKKTEREEREERELEEAIRLSLADSHPSPTTSESKGKAPASAPVKDIASSTAEVHAIDASFAALANEFVFPPQLDFSTSRTASPTRNAAADESVIAKLSYSTQNQTVRFYHQALTGLLARLDAVDSFGDEGLRHERKEVVGRVEGAMDEVERVVEGRWRKWAGRERAVEPAAPLPADAVVASENKDVPAAPVDSQPVAAPEFIPESIFESSSPSLAEATQSDSPSHPPSSEPASAAESVATLHPPSPRPSSPGPSDISASPAPSAIDTFLLSGSSAEPIIQKNPRASDSDADVDVGSDWSEVDA